MTDQENIQESRSPDLAYNFVRRFSKNMSKSDVSEALNASTASEAIGWNIDALNHMGFICQLGKVAIDKISSEVINKRYETIKTDETIVMILSIKIRLYFLTTSR